MCHIRREMALRSTLIKPKILFKKRIGPWTTRNLSSISDYAQQHKTPLVTPSDPVPESKYGGRHTVTMIEGTGVGPELMEYVRKVYKAVSAPVDFESVLVDPKSPTNEDVQFAITSVKRNGVAIKGAIEDYREERHVPSRDVTMRNGLDLYVNIIEFKSVDCVPSRHHDVDVVMVRQNTEGEYSMLEHELVPGVVENLKVVTRENSKRVARYAFEYAKQNNRKKVTVIHKANIMKVSDGLFMKVAKDISKDYPEIKFDTMIVDNCCMQLVTNPHQFDVMLTLNLYGNIVCNVMCGLLGGPGLFSERNYSDHYAVFESATRKSAHTLTGRNIANPLPMLNASVDLLDHINLPVHADLVRRAIHHTISEKGVHTRDLHGCACSSDVVSSILKFIRKEATVGMWHGDR